MRKLSLFCVRARACAKCHFRAHLVMTKAQDKPPTLTHISVAPLAVLIALYVAR